MVTPNLELRTPWSFGANNITDRIIDTHTIPSMLDTIKTNQSKMAALTWYSDAHVKRAWNYIELINDVEKYSINLKYKFSISRGDRVLIASKNSPFAFLTHLAIMYIGAVTVPIDPNESPSILRSIVERTAPKLILVTKEINESLLQSMEATGISCHPISSLDEYPSEKNPPSPLIAPDDSAVIIFTSGTTSSPKGVTLSHYNLLANAEGLKRAHNLNSHHVHGCVLPLYHGNAFGYSMITSIYTGCHVVLFCDSIGPNFWDSVQQMKINVLSLVPNIIQLLAKKKPKPEIKKNLHYVVSAAAPLSIYALREFEENTGIPIHQGYGLSECTNFATTIPSDIPTRNRQWLMSNWQVPSIGTPLFGTEMNVITTDGLNAEAEQEGEIVIRGHNVMKGYWSDPLSTSDAFREGVFHTGDLGFYVNDNEKRYFFITGRIKEIIIKKGECFSPTYIERELKDLLQLGAFAVCGFPNDSCGEEIGLYIYTKKENAIIMIKEILNQCPNRYRPRMVVVGESPIPSSVTGKVQRAKLKKFFIEGKSKVFGTTTAIQTMANQYE